MSEPVILGDGAATLYCGDCLDILPTLADNSFDGVLCDPSYGLNAASTERTIECLTRWLAGEPYKPTGGGFMGKVWDAWVPGPEIWREVYRVLKPGAHCLAFGGDVCLVPAGNGGTLRRVKP